MSTYTSHPDTHAQKHTQELSVKHFGLSPPWVTFLAFPLLFLSFFLWAPELSVGQLAKSYSCSSDRGAEEQLIGLRRLCNTFYELHKHQERHGKVTVHSRLLAKSRLDPWKRYLILVCMYSARTGGAVKSLSSLNWRPSCSLLPWLWLFSGAAPHHMLGRFWNVARWEGFLWPQPWVKPGLGEHLWHLLWSRAEEWARHCQITQKGCVKILT